MSQQQASENGWTWNLHTDVIESIKLIFGVVFAALEELPFLKWLKAPFKKVAKRIQVSHA